MKKLWTAIKVRLFLFSLWRRGEDWEVDMTGWDCGHCTPIPSTGQPTCPRGEDCHYLTSGGGYDEDWFHDWKRDELEDEANAWFPKFRRDVLAWAMVAVSFACFSRYTYLTGPLALKQAKEQWSLFMGEPGLLLLGTLIGAIAVIWNKE